MPLEFGIIGWLNFSTTWTTKVKCVNSMFSDYEIVTLVFEIDKVLQVTNRYFPIIGYRATIILVFSSKWRDKRSISIL